MTLDQLHARDGVKPNARALRPANPAAPKVIVKDAPPCVHLGVEPVGEIECPTCGGRRVKLKLFACAHPDKPLGEQVCKKHGCGPKCSGYTIEETPAIK